MINRIATYRRSGGFTLLEVIVAFAILSLSLGVIYQVFGQGLKAADQAEKFTLATLRAQSLLAEVGITSPLAVGSSSGVTADGYRWQIETMEYRAAFDDEITPHSYQIGVSVGWGTGEQEVKLTSIRLARNRDDEP
jgi:general secretion pathway protein I